MGITPWSEKEETIHGTPPGAALAERKFGACDNTHCSAACQFVGLISKTGAHCGQHSTCSSSVFVLFLLLTCLSSSGRIRLAASRRRFRNAVHATAFGPRLDVKQL